MSTRSSGAAGDGRREEPGAGSTKLGARPDVDFPRLNGPALAPLRPHGPCSGPRPNRTIDDRTPRPTHRRAARDRRPQARHVVLPAGRGLPDQGPTGPGDRTCLLLVYACVYVERDLGRPIHARTYRIHRRALTAGEPA